MIEQLRQKIDEMPSKSFVQYSFENEKYAVYLFLGFIFNEESNSIRDKFHVNAYSTRTPKRYAVRETWLTNKKICILNSASSKYSELECDILCDVTRCL